MKLRKKIASLLTAMVCTVSICAGGYGSMIGGALMLTYGEQTKYDDYLYYQTVDEDEDGTYDYALISDCDESAVSVEIPVEIDGLPVVSIGIGAFENCTSLAGITIPYSVTSIGKWAFEACTNLSDITIPDSVMSIGSDAFSGTALLENQTGVKYVCDWAVDCDEDVTSAEIKDGTRGIANSVFCDCTKLSDITIPDSVISIENWAFSKCVSLSSITIPDSVTSMGNYVFDGCTSLSSITIGNSVTSIGEHVFFNCTSLENVTIGNSVTSIGFSAFYGCTSLASITIPDSVTGIGVCAFYGTALLDNQTGPLYYADTWVIGCDEDVTSAEIKDGTRGIADVAFYAYYGSTLSNITIPDSVIIIGDTAFSGCTSLESITIENPKCKIYDDEETISDTATIYGYKNSTAQTYAENYDRTFVALDSENPTETEPTTEPDNPDETIDPSLATKYGDVNNDGTVDVADVVQLNIYVLNKTENPLGAVALANSDCTRDGVVDSADSALIINYVAMVVSYDVLGAL